MTDHNRPATARPDKATVQQLLAAAGQTVTMTQHQFTSDVDGIPSGVVTSEHTGVLAVSPQLLGWTTDELEDPTITH